MSSMTGSGEIARVSEKNTGNMTMVKSKPPKTWEEFEKKENGDLIRRLKEKAKYFGY